MKIAMAGAGRVATHLSTALARAGHDITQVYSRTAASAQRLADKLGAQPLTDPDQLTREADAIIVSVSDNALPTLLPRLCSGRTQSVIIHTAGSMPLGLFDGLTERGAVLYPMQTFSHDRPVDMAEVPVFIEATNAETLATVQALAGSISSHVSELSSDDRRHLHLAAVWACNFVNHCYDVASMVLEHHGLDFSVMLPLIDETARKVHQLSPREAQTGPAVRLDRNVIDAQAQLMADIPTLQALYRQLSLSIHQRTTT